MTGVNPVTYFHRGREAPFGLSSRLLQTFLLGLSAKSDLTRGESFTMGLSGTFFFALTLTKFPILAVIESLEKGMRKM